MIVSLSYAKPAVAFSGICSGPGIPCYIKQFVSPDVAYACYTAQGHSGASQRQVAGRGSPRYGLPKVCRPEATYLEGGHLT